MTDNAMQNVDVAIIGAGPSGAVAAALLRKAGRSALVLESQHFPRFSIGESLLPQSMEYLEEADMLRPVIEAGFQFKNGARFVYRGEEAAFDFRDKYSAGWGTTYQVARADFDDLLIRCAKEQGAEVRFGHTVKAMLPGAMPQLEVEDEAGNGYRVSARFVFDASGFARILPRLLNLEAPSRLPVRSALFSHVNDALPAGSFDRDKICIAVHPDHRDVWYWMIPLANGRTSVGCVADADFLDVPVPEREALLRRLIRTEPTLNGLIGNAPFLLPVNRIGSYSANVTQLYGDGYALLGNAGEFLDPVFSSGVTIALKSSSLAVSVLLRQLDGAKVDWQTDYEAPLRKGIDTFYAFVERWYSGALQDIIFYPHKNPTIRRMISAVLAGYAWDESNPYVADAGPRLDVLHETCMAAG